MLKNYRIIHTEGTMEIEIPHEVELKINNGITIYANFISIKIKIEENRIKYMQFKGEFYRSEIYRANRYTEMFGISKENLLNYTPYNPIVCEFSARNEFIKLLNRELKNNKLAHIFNEQQSNIFPELFNLVNYELKTMFQKRREK